MKEWIDHYVWQGVDHFYLINNESDDNYMDILQPYITQGRVTLYDRKGKNVQEKNYNDVFAHIKNETKWLIVCDLDEFIFNPKPRKNIGDYLIKKDKFSCICMNWKMFGSTDDYNHPESIRNTFIRRGKDLWSETKCIVKCSHTSQLRIHTHIVDGPQMTENTDLHLNHYPIQSKEFFDKVKKTRGDACYTENVRDDTYFRKYDLRDVEDTGLRDLIKTSQQKHGVYTQTCNTSRYS